MIRHASMSADKTFDLASIRARLSAVRGRQYWRSLEELAETPEFTSFVQREFPQHASEWLDPVGRRGFLKLMGASLALAGATACTRQPDELIVPYVRQPEDLVPASRCSSPPRCRSAASAIGPARREPRGAADQDRRQSRSPGQPRRDRRRTRRPRCCTLYDPDRSQPITYLGEIRPWGAFVQVDAAGSSASARRLQGAGLRFLTETVGVADARRRRCSELLAALPAGEVAPVRAGQPRQRARRRARSPSARPVETTIDSTRPT